MLIRTGFDISYDCFQPTPMLLMLDVHPSRAHDVVQPASILFNAQLNPVVYQDQFGNVCTRIVAPPGRTRITTDIVVRDSGLPDEVNWDAEQWPVETLPNDVLIFLLGSRYCETDRMADTAWALFGQTQPGWARVQAIVDYVNDRITFGYQYARSTKTAFEAHTERQGVCRDFAHLAVTLCRCMNVPARYCTGYLGDIGIPPVDAPMDFSAWFEVFLSGRWYTFDARHNTPRIGRIVMARGRDATDVAITTTFGPCTLVDFNVHTDEVQG